MTIHDYSQLSEKEKNAYCILCDLNGETFWHIYISHAILDGSIIEFRKLLYDIKSLPLMKRYAMKHTIGYRAIKAIIETENLTPQFVEQ